MITLSEKFASRFIDEKEVKLLEKRLDNAYSALVDKSGKGNDFLGWFDLPVNFDKDEVERIKRASAKIKQNSDALIVIGIGGSYLGAKAALDFLKTPYYNQLEKDTPEIYFLGTSFSGEEIKAVLDICKNKRVSINVISKSGTTAEPAIAFRLVLAFMASKYTEEEQKERIYVTTDAHKGALLSFAKEKGYECFVVPDDIGGRYSVFSAVGLFPLAVAGCNIDDMIAGTKATRQEFLQKRLSHTACRYALLRNYFLQKGKGCEILVSYDPFLRSYGEWWKQLFGESEGKNGKGIYPTTAIFSTDLHSLGQYVQDGQRMLFETVLTQKEISNDMTIPHDPNNLDGLNYISGKILHEVNHKAFLGTSLAHSDGGVPVLEIGFDKKDELNFGMLCYFFFVSCGISAYILDVNPFDQPGVEAYKRNMFALLGKPGYEDAGILIEDKIKSL